MSPKLQSPPAPERLRAGAGVGTRQEQALLAKMGNVMANLLMQAQPSVDSYIHYGKARTAWAWAVGNARPVEAIEAKFGPPAVAMGVPVGKLLATRTMEDGAPAVDTRVSGEDDGQIWYVYVQFFWRTKAKTMERWPIMVGSLFTGFATVASLDVAVYPQAQYESEDKLPLEILEEKITQEIEQTVRDIEDLPRATAPWWRPVGIGLGAVLGLFMLSKLRRR